MKITQEMRSTPDISKQNVTKLRSNPNQFSSMVEEQSRQLKEQELDKLIKNLTEQGERLAKARSFQDLAKYKRMVKDFVKETIQYGMELNHSHSWSRGGNSRKLTTVDMIDDKLVELTETVIDQEKKSIHVLGMIGEIKGLLVNLYR
ncbi:YaaR family protein [Sediminibacillus massiliensis]|uniref:YaaR family protein n=1 Tax=Sediminibacillus massiliensis TaxID=1926277 RepID=UPI0009886628|nr:YaaR family protein [Sediminibacillus massiliensis]